MKKVISYSLFWMGKDEHSLLYSNGIKAICRAHHSVFPGWEWRIYHDGTIGADRTAKILPAYEKAGLVKLVDIGAQTSICKAMISRMRPVWDTDVQITLCRDMDSLPTPRDAMAVAQFIESRAAMHCLADHLQHGACIMGGLCGFRNEKFLQITKIPSYESFISGEPLDRHGDDQLLLGKKVWPHLQFSLCEHRMGGSKTPHAIRSYDQIPKVDLPGVLPAVLEQADSLIPFMGAPGFDYHRAEAFYNEHGDPVLMQKIAEVEASL